MTSGALVRRGSRVSDRVRLAEESLWRHHGLVPTEHFVRLARPAIQLRFLEVGSGEPLVLVHGTVGPGGWPSLVEAMPGHRFLLLDRPGWGGSDPVDFRGRDYHELSAKILASVLDALELDRATIVGASIGDVWALSLAQLAPSRVDRLVLLGAGPLLPEVQRPGFIRLLASPLGALIVRLPVSADRARAILRDNGHGPSLEAGRIPDEFIAWRVAISNDTPAIRHERAMVRAVVAGPGWAPTLPFDADDLAAIGAPTLMVVGSADPTGSLDLWRRLTSTLPSGTLEIVEGAGHMPWFDAPERVARSVEGFLSA